MNRIRFFMACPFWTVSIMLAAVEGVLEGIGNVIAGVTENKEYKGEDDDEEI